MPVSPTSQQAAIINHIQGPALVIAGPGAGKTYTLVQKVIRLLVDEKIPPDQLFIATFTEKAAQEIEDRISRELLSRNVSINFDEMYIGTFHSICLRFLEDNRDFTRLKKNFSVMDQFDQAYFFFQRLQKFEDIAPVSTLLDGQDKISRWNRAAILCQWMNKLSEECVDPQQLIQDDDIRIQALGKWHILYCQMLEEENLLDFSFIQVEALKLLESNPETVLGPLKEKINYFLIDEYQDTNTVQEKLIFTLMNDNQNICVVGDDDQGLYRFRGATIRNILEFPKRFPDKKCAIYSLDINFRSDPGIIDFYNKWMDGSLDEFSWDGENGIRFRYEKSIKAPMEKAGIGNPVIRVSGSGEQEAWNESVLRFLQQLSSAHISDWNQVAFLFRSVKNSKVKALAQFLEENGIPVYAPRSDLFFERSEIRALVGAFLFLFPIFKEIRTEWQSRYEPLEVWDYYDSCLTEFAQYLRNNKINEELRQWCVYRAKEIQNMLISNKPLDFGFSELFYRLLQFPLFSQWLNIQENKRDERPARNIAIFSQLLVKFEYLHHIQVLHPEYLKKNVTDFFNNFLRYVHDGGISEFEDANDTTPSGAVAFMTIHQSKGLEFPVTFVGSLDAFPRSQRSELDEILERKYYSRAPFEPSDRIKHFDQKRLFYTAFSRAKNLLVLTCLEKRGRGRKCPSKYFEPFYESVPYWKKGKLPGLVVDEVKSSAAMTRYSYTSHVLVYEGCPRQYQFFKYWEFMPVREGPMIFGQLVHQTIEDIHKHVLRGETDAITETNARLWFDVNYANLSHKERMYLAPHIREVAFEHVLRYMERKAGKWSNIRDTEVDVSLVKGDYILAGKIDLIQGEGNTVEVVDFKSTAKPDLFSEREIINRYKRQLEIYAHLVENRYNLKVSGMNLYYTGEESGVPVIHFPYKRESIENTISDVERIIGKMEQKEFGVAKRPDKLCKECDLKALCDRG